MKAVIYARVSSKEQEKEGYSIPAQLKKTKELALKRNLSVVKEFVDVESAKQAGRKSFNEMIAFLRKQKDVQMILCHKVDRLCRNFKDYVTIDELRVKPIFVEEEFPDNAAGKLTFGMKVLLAKHYIDNLSDEVKKGQEEKLSQGGWPGRWTPPGYTRVNKDVVVDEEKAHWIRKAFAEYASGQHSLSSLREVLYRDGLRSRTEKKLSKSRLADTVLANPFYYGLMSWNGKMYEGKHEPLVSKELFDQVQAMLKRKNIPKKQKHDFYLRGLMRCGECGCMITATIAKGHHYYYCTRFKPCTQKKYMREEALDEKVLEMLEAVRMDEDVLAWVKQGLKESHEDEKEYHEKTVSNLEKRHALLKGRIDKLYDDKVDEKIDEEFFQHKFNQYTQERFEVLEQMKKHAHADTSYFELGVSILELAHRVHSIYKVRKPHEKREILNILVSNLILKDETLVPHWRMPFDLIAQHNKNADWRRGRDSNPRGAFDPYTLSRRAPSTARTPLQKTVSIQISANSRNILAFKQACLQVNFQLLIFKVLSDCRRLNADYYSPMTFIKTRFGRCPSNSA